ncbi:MAG: tRNA adenosine(34) deaminase TadA [Acidobacteriia bacterium]|nr:tRNA adenosine(34) deaminase TadA [Terriglobia bacterium]
MERATAEQWMLEALAEARKAESAGEIPVGAIVLINDKIVGRGHNHSVHLHDPSAHAEILALRQAARNMKNYRLPGSILIVTVEPCVMCAGAMIQARVEEVIYGATDPKAGSLDSHFHLASAVELNHRFEVMSGILEGECSFLMRTFFASRRQPPSY